jgi:hypothetical protein
LDANDANLAVRGKVSIVHRACVIPDPSPGAYIGRSRNCRPELNGLTMANLEPPPDFPPQMRPQAFADFLGVSLKTVQRNIERGMPVIAGGGKGFAKSIPVAAALAWLSGPPPTRRRGRPPNVSRRGDVQPARPHLAVVKAPPAPSPVNTPALMPPYALAPQYDPNVAMQR